VMAAHSDKAKLHLGGVPMIVADSIEFVRHDLSTLHFIFLSIYIVV